MTFKDLDSKLKNIVEKYQSILPVFNTGNQFLDIISRSKYTSENKELLKEINDAVDEYLSDKINLSMNEKQNLRFLKDYYKTKYEFGFNFPGGADYYQSLFPNL